MTTPQNNDVELFECRVLDMAGEATTHTTSSVEDLRMRFAFREGVLYPCIVLLKRSDGSVIEDGHDFARIFDAAAPQPFEISMVNNEEGSKLSVKEWSGKEWSLALAMHMRYKDESIVQRAEPLVSADDRFGEKMRGQLRSMIDGASSFEKLDEVAEEVKAMVAFAVDVNEPNDNGYVLLHRAAQVGHIEILNTLIQAAANVNVNVGFSPFLLAVRRGHAGVAQALLDAGADPLPADDDGYIPIHFAALFQQVDMISHLLGAGADANAVNNDGQTPLHCAFDRRPYCLDTISLLLGARADVNATTNEGLTALHYAFPSSYDFETLDILVDARADVNVPDNEGNTPLHYAVDVGSVNGIETLLKAGANANVRNNSGLTPYDNADGDERCKRALEGRSPRW